MIQYSKVEARIPMSVTVVTDDEVEHVWSREIRELVATSDDSLPTLEDRALAEWMSTLNAKLDAIIRILTHKKEKLEDLRSRRVIIGGGGMTFWASEKHGAGSLLEIKMLLELGETIGLCVYGKVTNAQPADGQFQTEAEFVKIDEPIREKIIEFVFRREREIIRKRHLEGL